MTLFRARLLERLASLGTPGLPPEDEGTLNQEVSSIIQHLQKLLNTRQGSSQIAPDFGLPDFTNIPGESVTDAGRRVEKILTKVIERYEPRLCRVKIEMETLKDKGFDLSFKLEGALSKQPDVPIVFETILQTNGSILVKR